MSGTAVEQRTANPKAEEWAERIAAQQRSGISVKQFCKDRGLTEYSFYAWRKRLQESGPVRFALVEKSARRQEHSSAAAARRRLCCEASSLPANDAASSRLPGSTTCSRASRRTPSPD